MLLCLEFGREVSRVSIHYGETVRYLGASDQDGTLPPLTRSQSGSRPGHCHMICSPKPRWKTDIRFGRKERGELVRYDMKSHQFLPFLSGISATDPTFSLDGKWVAYASYPERTLWRSRSDGTERTQLSFPPMGVWFPSISPDGTKVAFQTDKGLFVIGTEGGLPQKIDENG